MQIKRTYKIVFLFFIILYLLYLVLCAFFYSQQKSILFPSDRAKPVPADWRPIASDGGFETKIKGQCGALQVAIWRVKGAKGTIMMFHGNAESLSSIDEYAYAFLDLGYNLMSWDYAGYGQSTSCNFSQADLLKDSKTAYQWLSTQEKPEKIVLFGYSLGTGLALYTASQYPNHQVFLVSAYDSMINVAEDNIPFILPTSLLMRYPLPAKEWLNKIKSDVHIMHGTNDQLIKRARVEALVNQAGNNVKLELVQNAGHGDNTLYSYRNHWLQQQLH